MNIFNWFLKRKKDIIRDKLPIINDKLTNMDMDNKIESMSVKEYNQYLNKQKHNKFLEAKAKVETIIDQAYQDYIDECKRESKHIYDFFFIRENTYGITEDDIKSFLCKGKIKIKNYSVKWNYFEHSDLLSPDLLIDVLTDGD